MIRKHHHLAWLAGCSLMALAAAAPSYAQTTASEPASEETAIGEIVVTAQKRSQRLQDVPQTINVVGGEQLQKLSINTFQDIKALTPGLALNRTSGDEQSISLRGVKMPNGDSAGAANTVDVYFNEVPQSVFSAFSALYDVGQIEVLRGPQGTLRGRTSPSGSILVTTNRPSVNAWGGTIQGTVAERDTVNIQGGVGGPLSDTLAVRIAGVFDKGDDNGVRNITLDERSHHTTGSGRLTAQWRPTDDLEVLLVHQALKTTQTFYRSIEGTGAFSLNAGQTFKLKDRISIDPNPNRSNNEVSSTVLSATYDVEGHRLSYIGGYQETEFYNLLNLNLGNAPVAFPYAVSTETQTKILTQELRFESVGAQFWNYMVGAYYEKNKADYVNAVVPFFAGARSFKDIETVGLFTTQRFQLTEKDLLEGGLRYTRTEVDAGAGAKTYEAVTGNVSLSHRFSRDLMAYANLGTGYRPGGSVSNITGVPIPDSFFQYGEEKSRSAEIGLKSTLFDGKLELSAGAFHQKFDGYIGQFFLAACTGAPSTSGLAYATYDGTATGAECTVVSSVFNADAISKGFELDARARLTSNWRAQATFALAKATYDDAEVPCNDYNGDGTPDAVGAPRVQTGRYVSICRSSTSLGQIPKYAATVSSDYEHPVGPFTGFVRGLVSYQSSAYFPQTAWTQKDQALVDLYVGLREPDNAWELSLYAKNLLDNQQQDTEAGGYFSVGQDSGYHMGTVLKGRELGLTLRYTFGN